MWYSCDTYLSLSPQAQATKFGNFLVASKYAASLSDVMDLLTAARTLSNNEVG